MKNYSNIMLDLETLATTPNAKVLSISAVAFDPFDLYQDLSANPTLDLLLNLDEQENRDADPSTVEWWSKQDIAVVEKIFGETGRISVDDALARLAKFVWNKDRVWAQGITFDFPILESLYREHNKGIPWKYFKVTDSRTLLSLVEVEQKVVNHDSLADCYRQISGVTQALSKLGIEKFTR